MKSPSSSRGFTLIELLVVIAIIGILSAIVMASLGVARSRAKDASIRTEIESARAQAELFYTGNDNSFSGVCTDATNGILKMRNAASSTGSTDIVCADPSTNSALTWVMSAKLITPLTDTYVCTDSQGASTERATQITTTATKC